MATYGSCQNTCSCRCTCPRATLPLTFWDLPWLQENLYINYCSLDTLLQQSTWGLSGCLAEPAHSSSAVKESLRFIAAARVVWRGAVTLLGLMGRRGQRDGADGREKGVSHFHLLVRPIGEPLLFQDMAQSRASSCCWWQGLSCTSTLQARLGVYWGGILLRILRHPLSWGHSRRAAALFPPPLRAATCFACASR